ncbi:MAG: ribonucleotide reductase N-terminal alpha domain-containing protein [Petrotogales bacterium]
MQLKKVRKRTGVIVPFKAEKITAAIEKAMNALEAKDNRVAEKLTKEIVESLHTKTSTFSSGIPDVEQIQDTVENVLEKQDERLYKAYSLYRRSRGIAREIKQYFKIKDDLKLGVNAIKVLEERYLMKNEEGKIIETPTQLFRRVAKAIAKEDGKYGMDPKKAEEKFFSAMRNLEFLPNSPTLMNAGTPLGQLSACFVLPIEDSIESIFTTLKNMALIQQSGGGTGFTFSNLRKKGDMVKSTKGVASGPVSFIKIYDSSTDVIKQGGKRRGANMGILHCTHPDIEEFVTVKSGKKLTNFNISVAMTDVFLKKVLKDEKVALRNPRDNKISKRINAKRLFDLIVKNAWKTGDPGIIFIDEINRKHPLKSIGKIEATNPCVTKNTWIMTADGPRLVKELIGRKTEIIVNGEKWSNLGYGFFNTGVRPVIKLETKEGYELFLTENHPVKTVTKLTRYSIKSEWKKAGDLKLGDKVILNNHQNLEWNGRFGEKGGYLIGSLMGDGSIPKDKVILDSWRESKGEKKVRELINNYVQGFPHRGDFKEWKPYPDDAKYRLSIGDLKRLIKELKIDNEKEITPEIEKSSSEFYKGFLKGFFDTGGSVQGDQKKGVSIRLIQSKLQRLKAVQRMLLRLGIFSKIYKEKKKPQKKRLPDGRGGYKLYKLKAQHELVVSAENIIKFYNRIGFENSDKLNKLEICLGKYKRKLNRERFIATINNLTAAGVKKTYDIQVPGLNAFDANGFYVHNCGEVPLLSYESCNLGSINLAKMAHKGKINWDKIRDTTRMAVHFLDNVIDANKYPLAEIEGVTKANRKIGLGIMGFADLLLELKIPYNSKEAITLGEKIISFIAKEARQKSIKLGELRGSFENFKHSVWQKKYPAMRNATCTTIAPTGTISIIAGCSSGIEPLFALVFFREVMEGKKLLEINERFKLELIKRDLYSDEMIDKISREGSIKKTKLPEDIKRVFITALDIPAEFHVRMQAAFQRHVDNAVSKTVNLHKESSAKDVRSIYLLAWRLKCKGITIYRYGSKPEQVLYLGTGKPIVAKHSYAGGCPTGICPL